MVVTMQCPPSVYEVAFAGVPGGVAVAREWAVAVSRLTGDRADVLSLLVSELATNAVRHSRSGDEYGAYTVTVAVRTDAVLVVVADTGPRPEKPTAPLPCLISPFAEAEGGYGLSLVVAIADAWTISSSPGRTQVGFELRKGEGNLEDTLAA
ncbi:anti-sigma regulatory factor (Ser/Thr protein kinase) [Murinocardiopsis flavida]|uniref:Anti-sigma regulatory factor (Ser/Thr protein kinase) n=1 Tax=Murinocardiopsis flavida TaxID=645275 RepID=A0A2P8CY81_9ACTN|nr:ATP-binding protein [Murinocardiopsis flavida]PSK89922.1 anti-sigma regulatory factor (Ser/Thr protein kinase) [Murinocardiopsis flavida]